MTCYQVAVGTLAAAGLDPPPFFFKQVCNIQGVKTGEYPLFVAVQHPLPSPPPPPPPSLLKNLARPLLDLLVMESCALTIGPMCVT